MEVHFIINPYAGNGQGVKRWHQFERQLTIPYQIHWTKYEGHSQLLAKEIAGRATKENPVCLIAIGGDGTIHEVLNGAVHFGNVYLGAISAGSGNDFARGYQAFETGKQLQEFVNRVNSTSHDCGVVRQGGNTKYFINNFGVGFDALVANIANKSTLKRSLNKWKLGKLSYPYYVIHALFTYKPFKLKIVQVGKEKQYQNVWFVTASNQPYFGGGMKLSPKSDTSDGQLELTVVSNLSKWKLLFLFGTVFLGKHTLLKEVEQFAATDVQLIFEDPVLVHADGETQKLTPGQNTIEISVQKNAWNLAK